MKSITGRLSRYTVQSSGCWEWNGCRLKAGYGLIHAKGLTQLVHRVAYGEWVGPIPSGMNVCHRCDNPSCINSAHLYAGTQGENRRESVRKDRHAGLREAQVLQIVELARTTMLAGTEIARIVGANRQNVYDVTRGKTFTHLTSGRLRRCA